MVRTHSRVKTFFFFSFSSDVSSDIFFFKVLVNYKNYQVFLVRFDAYVSKLKLPVDVYVFIAQYVLEYV